MKKDKLLNRVSVLLIIIAMLVTGVLAYAPQMFSLKSMDVVYASTVFDKEKVMTVNIIMDDDKWSEMLENAGKEEYYPCDIEINGTRLRNVGIRPKGNTSLMNILQDDTTDRFSFKVEFDHYEKGQTFDGLDKLCLNNIMSDSSYMKEYIVYDMLTYLGVSSSLYSFASIQKNGEQWGLYIAFEAIEESFMQRNYGKTNGKLYKPENSIGGAGKDGEKGGMPDFKDAFPDGIPEDFKGGLPDGFPEDFNDGFPEDFQGDFKDGLPENFQDGGNPEDIPQGNKEDKEAVSQENGNDKDDKKNSDEKPDAKESKKNLDGQGRPGGQGGPGGMSMGSDLAYIDDNADSYNVIWNSVVNGQVTDKDKERVITALKHISELDNLEDYMDVDSMLRYMAANVIALNDDSYFGNMLHNYYLYEEDGVLTMLPWDYNLSFGGMGMGSQDATSLINRAIDGVTSQGSYENRPFIKAALSTDEYKEQYHTYLRELIDGYFTNGTFEKTVAKLRELITPYVENDPTAFYKPDEFEKGVDTLVKFVNARVESVQKQLDGEIASTKEGRNQNSDNLVDGSGINISDMGTFGMGKGGMPGFGDKKDAENTEQKESSVNEAKDENEASVPNTDSEKAGEKVDKSEEGNKVEATDEKELPDGMRPSEGKESPDGKQPPSGMEFPEGMEPPSGMEFPDGKRPPDGMEFPDGMQPPDGF